MIDIDLRSGVPRVHFTLPPQALSARVHYTVGSVRPSFSPASSLSCGMTSCYY